MKRVFNRTLSLLLATAMVCGPLPAAQAAGYSDTEGHWAEAAIDRWSGYGIVSGHGDAFRPNDAITRAQRAKILSNTLGLTETQGNPFTDVKDSDWFAPYVERCYAAGILLGSNSQALPGVQISRQQSMVMLAQSPT